jgi:thiol-disulfide isomerase/thioredoxin
MNEIWMVTALVLLTAVVIVQGILLMNFIETWRSKFHFTQTKQTASDFDVTKAGLALGEAFPRLKPFRTPSGDLFQLALGKPSLILLTSENCQACRTLLPQLRGFGAGLPVDIWILQVGTEASAVATQEQVGGPIRVAAIDSETAHGQLKTKMFPFGFLLDGNGTVATKSIVPSREHAMAMIGAVGLPRASGASHG